MSGLRIAILFGIGVLGIVGGVALIYFSVEQPQPHEVTIPYWYVEREVLVVEKNIGGMKTLVPLQTVDEKAKKKEYQTTITPSSPDTTTIVIVSVFAGGLMLVVLVLVGANLWFEWHGKKFPPALNTLLISTVAMMVGAVGGFLGGRQSVNPSGSFRLPSPPTATAKP
jgi:hypothetical protein